MRWTTDPADAAAAVQAVAEEAETCEAMKQHMYVIADALAGAIEKQFSNKFG